MPLKGCRVKGVSCALKRALKRTPLAPVARRMTACARTPLEDLPDAPDIFRSYRYFNNHPELERRPGGWRYKGRFYPDYLTVGGACRAIEPVAERYCRGRGIDVGAGFWPLPGAVPVDVSRGPGVEWTVADFEDASLDYVFSSHCLEHISDWEIAFHGRRARVDSHARGGQERRQERPFMRTYRL